MILYISRSFLNLIDKWISWHNRKISSHDFCMEFEKVYRTEIEDRMKSKKKFKKRILREMVRGE